MGLLMNICVTLLMVVINAELTLAWRHNWKGHRWYSNLGNPSRNILLPSSLPPDEWFIQYLDHFDPTNHLTWKQRFYTNDQFYKPGGPVFIMIGGEGEATSKWMVEGAWVHYAKEHNALLFELEHRFYGKSRPTENVSTENLKYLSSEQALADLAFFITEMNSIRNLTTKWIAFGGSYPGSLAAWLRQKYPHLVHGAISSSGPLLAKSDFYEFYDVVTKSLATHSDECVDAVGKSINQVETLLRHMIGQRNINEKFSLCDPVEQSIENPLDMSNLFETLATTIAGVVQYNKDHSPHAKVTIDQICDIMVNKTIGPPYLRFAKVNHLLLTINQEQCLDYKYEKMIFEMKNISWDSSAASGGRQWTYQTCTEFGFFQTSDNTSHIFGNRFNVDFFIRQCSDIFGPSFNAASQKDAVFRTNTNYGELHAETTNVIYVHGSIDPWHALGLTNSNVSSMPTIYILGTAHCANMYEPQDGDLPQLKAARVEINKFISSLL